LIERRTMDAPKSNSDRSSPEFIEELKRRRRRERWSAFLTPLITLVAMVLSIGFLMFIIRTCALRAPQEALFEPSSGPSASRPFTGPPRPQQVIG
jgi:hypothetical protein